MRSLPSRCGLPPTSNRARLSILLLASFCALGLGLGAVPAIAQSPDAPPYFAVVGGTVHTVGGEVIDGGTVLIENGLITAVGTELDIPKTARVIDAEGLSLYPGLIDATSTVGAASPGGRGGGAGGRGASSGGRGGSSSDGESRPYSTGPEDRPGTTPWRVAAHQLDAESEAIETWREGGFTTVLLHAEGGIFPGQASLVNLAGERPSHMVLRPTAALPIDIEGGGYRGFPGSLMGRLAYIHQLFADAEHYERAWSAYESDPRGQERPHYDRTLEPLVRARAEGWPVLIPAAWSKEIVRALELGEALGVRTIVEGAHQGYAAVDRLRAADATVLVSVDWPERSPDADPDEPEPLRVLEMRDRAPSTPQALHEAGVAFALVSGGAKSPGDVLAGARAAIEAGLPADAALRALTLSPASIFGIDDRLGSVEVGKIANLVVTEGDLFAEKSKVRHVFVDGRLYSLPVADEADDDGADDADGKDARRGKKRRPGNAEWLDAFGDDGHPHDHSHDHEPHCGEDRR